MDWFGGKTALVTGAAHGIGRGTTALLQELGAQVVALDRDEQGLRDAFGGVGPILHVADVAEAPEILAQDIVRSHGPIDLLVNNVGIDTPRSFMELPEGEFDEVFATNLRGPWFLTRELTARMIQDQRRGAVVFVSSLHDSFVRGRPHYSASKAAVAMLVKELAQELGPLGIRVNAVSPGVIATDQTPAPRGAEAVARIRRLVPLGRVGQPQEVARIIAVLLSDHWAQYVNGANVRVDGGLGTHSWSSDP